MTLRHILGLGTTQGGRLYDSRVSRDLYSNVDLSFPSEPFEDEWRRMCETDPDLR